MTLNRVMRDNILILNLREDHAGKPSLNILLWPGQCCSVVEC